MTPEEKVAILKKAGVWDVIGFPSCIDKLFELVAAHEREACAKVCEEGWKEGLGAKYQGDVFAEAIRARGRNDF